MRTESTPRTTIGVNTAAVTAWFGRLGITHTGPLRFDRIGLGQSNLTFLVRDRDNQRWVLRRPPLGELLASAHDVVREAQILQALELTDVPVPRILGVAAAGAVGAAPLVLMEYVDGVVVDRESVLRSLTPPQRHAVAMSMVDTLVRIHAVDLNTTGLSTLASHRPYAQRQLKRWTRQWHDTWSGDNNIFDALTARLEAAAPVQHEIRLVHGDFHLRNVITSPGRASVVAALDWELSTLGDPLADIGSTLAYWPTPGEIAYGHGLPALEGVPGHTELTDAYLAATGRDGDALRFWYVLGLWKIAVIYAGVMRRAVDEPQNRTDIKPPEPADIVTMLGNAVHAADEAGF